MNAPRTARERARAELTAEITDAARRQLADVGPTDLSLRAIARDLGMASSAIYRYFASRDALLTALIVDAYDSLGEAVEAAEALVDRGDHLGRWMTATRAARTWALDHRHEYSLIYGSPVPGYAAPTDTIDPAGRVGLVVAAILADAAEAGVLGMVAGPQPVDGLIEPGVVDQLGADPAHAAAGVQAWTWLFGAISFELFGHYNNVVVDPDEWFDDAMARLAHLAGLTA